MSWSPFSGVSERQLLAVHADPVEMAEVRIAPGSLPDAVNQIVRAFASTRSDAR